MKVRNNKKNIVTHARTGAGKPPRVAPKRPLSLRAAIRGLTVRKRWLKVPADQYNLGTIYTAASDLSKPGRRFRVRSGPKAVTVELVTPTPRRRASK